MRESKKESIINEKEAAVKKNEEVKPEKKNEETAAEKQEQKPEIKKEKIKQEEIKQEPKAQKKVKNTTIHLKNTFVFITFSLKRLKFIKTLNFL